MTRYSNDSGLCGCAQSNVTHPNQQVHLRFNTFCDFMISKLNSRNDDEQSDVFYESKQETVTCLLWP